MCLLLVHLAWGSVIIISIVIVLYCFVFFFVVDTQFSLRAVGDLVFSHDQTKTLVP